MPFSVSPGRYIHRPWLCGAFAEFLSVLLAPPTFTTLRLFDLVSGSHVGVIQFRRIVDRLVSLMRSNGDVIERILDLSILSSSQGGQYDGDPPYGNRDAWADRSNTTCSFVAIPIASRFPTNVVNLSQKSL